MARRRSKLRTLMRLALWGAGTVGVLLAIAAGALTLVGMPTYPVPTIGITVESSPQRVAHGKKLVALLCARCHFDSIEGRLRGRNLIEISTRQGKVAASNLTRHPTAGIGEWDAGQIALLLRTGLHPNTATLVPAAVMPRWPRMSDEDLVSIIAFLQSDDPWVEPDETQMPPSKYSLRVKFRAYTSWSPLPYPRERIDAVDPSDLDARGGYLVDHLLQCAACHSDNWGDIDPVEPARTVGYLGGGAATDDINGVHVRAANLTPHATGLGDWTFDELYVALVKGFGPDGKVMRWPMVRYPGLSRTDVEAIHAYLQSVEPIDNEVPPSPAYRQVGRKADAGLHVYTRYGCHWCHGITGVGVGDLRRAATRYPTDAELVTFLRDPSRANPYSPMPAWHGVIAEEDYRDLVQFVRRLGVSDDEPE